MYRDKEDLIHVNFLIDIGGLGDLIGTLPTIDYIYRHHSQIVIHFWVPDFALDFCERSLPKDKQRVIIRKFSENKKYNDKFYGRALGLGKHTNLATHMTRHAFNMFLNVEVPIEEMNYLSVNTSDIDITKFGLPEKYVIIATGFTAEVREFLPKYINSISKYIISKGYIPVFLGKKETFNGYKHTIKGQFKEEIDLSSGINLVDSTNLVECQKIIADAKAIVGLDNGLLHVAGTTSIPIVGGFTTVLPEHRMPVRNGILGWNYYPVTVPKEKLKCIGCQSNWSFGYEIDFTKCHYVEKKLDKEIQCVSLLDSSLYIKELERIL